MRLDPVPIMKQCQLFEGFSEEELEVLAAALKVTSFQSGQTIMKEGETASSFYIIVDGTVSVYKEVGEQFRQHLADVGPHRLIGELSLIDRQPRSATIEAKTDVLALECSLEDFDRLFDSNSKFAYKVLDFVVRDLARRLREANEQLEKLYVDPGKTLNQLFRALVKVEGAVHKTGQFKTVK